MTDKDKKLTDEAIEKAVSQDEAKSLALYEKFKDEVDLGIKKVDPADIRPPQIILVQKTTDLALVEDTNGNQAEIGQFYHTGKRVIYTAFNCNFIYAAKTKFINRFHDNEEWDQYQALGVLDDGTLFGMTFRSTALYALSKLFQAVKGAALPMFLFNCKVESQLIKGEKGDWYVPAIRVGNMVEDEGRVDFLHSLAREFDVQGEKVVRSLEDEQ